jgi:hypothetical protein
MSSVKTVLGKSAVETFGYIRYKAALSPAEGAADILLAPFKYLIKL